MGPLWGSLKGAHLPGTLKDEGRRDLETEYLNLWELYEANLEGGLLYWGPLRTC